MACQRLSEEDREVLRNEIASGLENPLGSSSSAGDTLGTSPEHRPLRGRVDDYDLDHTVEGYTIVPSMNKK